MYRTPDGLAVDIAVFSTENLPQSILLITRKNNPFKDTLALPGGFTEEQESLAQTAERELLEETGIKISITEYDQVRTYWYPGRDPRGWIPSVLYAVQYTDLSQAKAADDAKEIKIVHPLEIIENPEALAFDHHRLILDAYNFITEKTVWTT